MNIKELGHVVLYVTNLNNVADFYKETLGFREIARRPGMALFSSGRTHHEMLLIEIGGSVKPRHRPEPGLYHIGFKIGDSPEELRAAYRELELYADVSDKWKKNPEALLRPPSDLDLAE